MFRLLLLLNNGGMWLLFAWRGFAARFESGGRVSVHLAVVAFGVRVFISVSAVTFQHCSILCLGPPNS